MPLLLLLPFALLLPEAIPDPREPWPERESPGQHLTRRIGPYPQSPARPRNYRIHSFNWDASVLIRSFSRVGHLREKIFVVSSRKRVENLCIYSTGNYTISVVNFQPFAVKWFRKYLLLSHPQRKIFYFLAIAS